MGKAKPSRAELLSHHAKSMNQIVEHVRDLDGDHESELTNEQARLKFGQIRNTLTKSDVVLARRTLLRLLKTEPTTSQEFFAYSVALALIKDELNKLED